MKNLIRAIALSAALLFTAPGFAQHVRITLAPPALQTEVVPDRPYDGAVWQPGYYSYDMTTGSYNWVSGKWVAPPSSGLVWVAPSYRVHEGEYHFIPGHWKRIKY
jgi:hypothetical protein